jgi:hypothetical protein
MARVGADMATALTVACQFEVDKNLSVTRKARQTVREYSELLHVAGVKILRTLLLPSANPIDFVIDADGLEAARKAIEAAGIPISQRN